MKKSMKTLLAYFVLNFGTTGFGVIAQSIIRFIFKPDFVFPMLQFYTILLGFIMVAYIIDQTRKIRIWEEKQKKLMPEYLVAELAILNIKLENNCSIEEAKAIYWDNYTRSKFENIYSLENKIRFKTITREVNYEEIPEETRKKLEKAA